MLNEKLIESALALTGMTMEDMTEMFDVPYEEVTDTKFSIEKFCYYLLSPGFIALYSEEVERGYDTNDIDYGLLKEFGTAIYEYQSGNEKLLVELLSKI